MTESVQMVVDILLLMAYLMKCVFTVKHLHSKKSIAVITDYELTDLFLEVEEEASDINQAMQQVTDFIGQLAHSSADMEAQIKKFKT
jgi:hypothetical protein